MIYPKLKSIVEFMNKQVDSKKFYKEPTIIQNPRTRIRLSGNEKLRRRRKPNRRRWK